MLADNANSRREQLATDIHRPRFHYLPPSNWMNDPNGVIQWKGQYHLFYQYNPNGAYHDNIHWGHAVSPDLIHWQDLPVALRPTPNSVDEGGIFSGCMVNNQGTPTIIYTGVSGSNYARQVQCIAIGSSDLAQWEKYEDNPILADVPAIANQTRDFRDPFVWQADGIWYMVVGSGIKDVGGTVFLFHSDDLVNWQYLHPILTGDKNIDGVIWECPNFFQLDDRWVLIVSTHTGHETSLVKYFVGKFENLQFTSQYEAVLDHAYLYAPLTFVDDTGRRLLWGWLREGRSTERHIQAGWAGSQSIPRQLSLDKHHRLLMEPVSELESIRGKAYHFENVALSEQPLFEIRSLALDIVAELDLTGSGRLTFTIAGDGSGDEQTQLSYERKTSQLAIHRTYSVANDGIDTYPHIVHHQLDDEETLTLRIILDGSTLEVIANKRTTISSRLYPTSSENNFFRLSGAKTKLITLDIYEMPSIWQ